MQQDFLNTLKFRFGLDGSETLQIRMGRFSMFNGTLNDLADAKDSLDESHEKLLNSYLMEEPSAFPSTINITVNKTLYFRAEKDKGITHDWRDVIQVDVDKNFVEREKDAEDLSSIENRVEITRPDTIAELLMDVSVSSGSVALNRVQDESAKIPMPHPIQGQGRDDEGHTPPSDDSGSSSANIRTSDPAPQNESIQQEQVTGSDPIEKAILKGKLLEYLIEQPSGHQAESFELASFSDTSEIELVPVLIGLQEEGLINLVEGHAEFEGAALEGNRILVELCDRQYDQLPPEALPKHEAEKIAAADRLSMMLNEVLPEQHMEWLKEGIQGIKKSPITRMIEDNGLDAAKAMIETVIHTGEKARNRAFADSIKLITDMLGIVADGKLDQTLCYESESYKFVRKKDTALSSDKLTYDLYLNKGATLGATIIYSGNTPRIKTHDELTMADQISVISGASTLTAGIRVSKSVEAYKSTKAVLESAVKQGKDAYTSLQSVAEQFGDIAPRDINTTIEALQTKKIISLIQNVTEKTSPNTKGQKIFEGEHFTLISDVKKGAQQVFDRVTKQPLFSQKESGEVISKLSKKGSNMLLSAFDQMQKNIGIQKSTASVTKRKKQRWL